MSPNSYLGEFEQMVLLAILQQGERAFALEVRREIERSADRTVSRGAFYTTLERMEKKGLVSSEVTEPSTGGRATRNYRLLPEGERALRRSRELLERLWDGAEVHVAGESP